MVKPAKQPKPRQGPESNIIRLPFGKAIEGLLQAKPKKKSTQRKKKANK